MGSDNSLFEEYQQVKLNLVNRCQELLISLSLKKIHLINKNDETLKEELEKVDASLERLRSYVEEYHLYSYFNDEELIKMGFDNIEVIRSVYPKKDVIQK